MVTYAKSVVQNRHPGFHYESDASFCIFTLLLNISIYKLYDESNDDIYNMILMESVTVREVETVPLLASSTAIESLEKVKLEDDAGIKKKKKKKCSICLHEFKDNVEVSSMSFNHVYHQECIIT
ncbi:hypothetical protein JHK87_007148 [Glycine soja]|uniref:RING-type domain-containing protein n=1 Tax=Glycine max TaxID=3847 RepID=A0A0R0KIM3_SOYBN|nr:hypothetical protein JHK87_007148 [Glycine soja]